MEAKKVIIVGAGHRALIYASYAQEAPDRMQIVGVADLIPERREYVKKLYHLPDHMVFDSVESLCRQPRLADAVINGTMDDQHVDTTLPLLEKGYDVLLEKPFAVNEEEMWKLYEAAQKYNRTVCICHVLRHAPFYRSIKEKIVSGELGDIINIQMNEHVNYHHLAVSYIRGKWGNEEACGAGMLLAKCCHDIDLMTWFMNHTLPARVASFGSDFQFDESKKPAGAGTRCLTDCKIEESCLYSARKHYLDHPDRWSFYVWDYLIDQYGEPTLEQKEESLKTRNIHGRCVWDCNHTVVDHQSVLVEFHNGATATLNMIGGTSREARKIQVLGTKGEIDGCLDDSSYIIRKIDPRPGHEYSEEIISFDVDGDASGVKGTHGGGDLRLVADFIDVLFGDEPSIATTSIKDSVMGHLLVFKAEEARRAHQVVLLDKEYYKEKGIIK